MTRVLVADDPLEVGPVVANALAPRVDVVHADDLVPDPDRGSDADERPLLCETVARCRPSPDVVVAAWPRIDRSRLDALRRLLGSDPVATLVIAARIDPAIQSQLEAVTGDAVDVFQIETTDPAALDVTVEETLRDRIAPLAEVTVSSLAVAQTAATASSIQAAHTVCAGSRAAVDSEASGGTRPAGATDSPGRPTTASGATVPASDVSADGSVTGPAPTPLAEPTSSGSHRPAPHSDDGLRSTGGSDAVPTASGTDEQGSDTAEATTEPVAGPTIERDDSASRTPAVPPTVVIGASTGGPAVVEGLLTGLPATLDARILVVQHMPGVFTGRFADRLDTASEYTVVEPADGDRVEPGTAVVAPGDTHLRVVNDDGLRVALEEAPEDVTRPSIDVTMTTAARATDGPLCGVVCTGMGRDGAAGIEAIAEVDGYAIAQDEATSSIFGIPSQAIRTGCVDDVVPADRLAECVFEALGGEDSADG